MYLWRETYVRSWADCCSILSFPKGRRNLQRPIRWCRPGRRLRWCKRASAIECLGRKWWNKATNRSSSSRRLYTAAGCRRAPSKGDRHSRTIGNRRLHKSSSFSVCRRRTVESIQTNRTIQTNRLPCCRNLFKNFHIKT